MSPRGTQTQENVPDSELARVVAGFEAEGATVEKKKQPNGLWTVIAKFPDD
jgi:hypothetical protein